MPNFSKLFTLESDAYDNGLGVVLFQDEHPITFIDKSLSGKNLSTSTYEKEMMTILHTVHKWRPSLVVIDSRIPMRRCKKLEVRIGFCYV